MSRSLVERMLIAAATIAGAVICVWATNSIFPLIAVALVVHYVTMTRRTDNGAAIAGRPAGIERRTRRRDE